MPIAAGEIFPLLGKQGGRTVLRLIQRVFARPVRVSEALRADLLDTRAQTASDVSNGTRGEKSTRNGFFRSAARFASLRGGTLHRRARHLQPTSKDGSTALQDWWLGAERALESGRQRAWPLGEGTKLERTDPQSAATSGD
jgi:hypothetical protein